MALIGPYATEELAVAACASSSSSSSSNPCFDPPSLGVTAMASPSSGTAPLTVDFTCTPGGGVPPYDFSWSFEGGTPSGSLLQNPTGIVFSSPSPGRPYSCDVIVGDSCENLADTEVGVTVSPSSSSSSSSFSSSSISSSSISSSSGSSCTPPSVSCPTLISTFSTVTVFVSSTAGCTCANVGGVAMFFDGKSNQWERFFFSTSCVGSPSYTLILGCSGTAFIMSITIGGSCFALPTPISCQTSPGNYTFTGTMNVSTSCGCTSSSVLTITMVAS